MNKKFIDTTQSISIKNNITTQYKENYMKIFRELYFRGNPDQLQNFTNDIRKYVASDWEYGRSDRYGSSWIYFDYSGDKVDNARVCISTGEYIQQCELKVNNIVPMEKNQLSIEEYNAVLQKFYEDIIIPYTASNREVYITEPSSDEFNPLTVISHEALRKLEAFCNGANKSTGSSHPCDQERWFDFIWGKKNKTGRVQWSCLRGMKSMPINLHQSMRMPVYYSNITRKHEDKMYDRYHSDDCKCGVYCNIHDWCAQIHQVLQEE